MDAAPRRDADDADDAGDAVTPARDAQSDDDAVAEHGAVVPDRDDAPDRGTALPPASGRGASRRCPSCAAVNARSRELCVVCGLDLDPGDRTAVPPRTTPREPAAGSSPLAGTGWRRWWVPVVAVLAVVAIITGGMALAELGPFATDEEPLEPVAFPSERYPGSPEPLELVDVATLTSAAPEGERVFLPDRLVDGDPTTAWRAGEDDPDDGLSETIDVRFAEPAWVTAIAVSNGDHRDTEAYEASGRVQRMELRFDGDLVVAATLLDLGRRRQLIELDEPVLSTAVRLSLVEVLPGTVNPAPAMSSLEVRGHLADDDDRVEAEDRAVRRPAAEETVTSSGTRSSSLRWSRGRDA